MNHEHRCQHVGEAVSDDEPPAGDNLIKMQLQGFALARTALGRQQLAAQAPFVFAATDGQRKTVMKARDERIDHMLGGASAAQKHAASLRVDQDVLGQSDRLVRPADYCSARIDDVPQVGDSQLRDGRGRWVAGRHCGSGAVDRHHCARAAKHEATAVAVVLRLHEHLAGVLRRMHLQRELADA